MVSAPGRPPDSVNGLVRVRNLSDVKRPVNSGLFDARGSDAATEAAGIGVGCRGRAQQDGVRNPAPASKGLQAEIANLRKNSTIPSKPPSRDIIKRPR